MELIEKENPFVDYPSAYFAGVLAFKVNCAGYFRSKALSSERHRGFD